MRAIAAIALVALLLYSWPGPIAQPALPQCQPRPGALGVSRVVEINTSGGPRFGLQQYKDIDFLQDGEVVLTFDDGPLRSHTRAVLDALDAHCTKATFFVVGRMAIADPEMVRETARRGHTIGTHTWSHRNLRSLPPSQARYEIELGLSAVQAALGRPVAPFFRFPYLSDPQAVQAMLQQRGIGIFSIDVDAYDYRTPDAGTVHRNIMRQLSEKRKGILLFHDIQPSTARALKGLLDELKSRGFRVVHMVPQYTATTVAEFDAIADGALGTKRLAANGSPLAKRSVVWPLTADPVTVTPAPSASGLPNTGPPRPARIEEESWRTRVFQR
jgi:peptidoglycan/xylan/chitin deacetylase (PgdA/CDA1 family)